MKSLLILLSILAASSSWGQEVNVLILKKDPSVTMRIRRDGAITRVSECRGPRASACVLKYEFEQTWLDHSVHEDRAELDVMSFSDFQLAISGGVATGVYGAQRARRGAPLPRSLVKGGLLGASVFVFGGMVDVILFERRKEDLHKLMDVLDGRRTRTQIEKARNFDFLYRYLDGLALKMDLYI